MGAAVFGMMVLPLIVGVIVGCLMGGVILVVALHLGFTKLVGVVIDSAKARASKRRTLGDAGESKD